MDPYFHTYYSNRMEILLSELKTSLFANSSPLAKRFIIVPSQAMKSWISIQLAKDPNIGIAAGIEVSFVEPSIRKILLATTKQNIEKYYQPNDIELTLAIESKILNICQHREKYRQAEWLPLIRYIGLKDNSKHQRNAIKRISDLAKALADVFINYGIYGKEMVLSWQENSQIGWQELLWLEMEQFFYPWAYPAKTLSNIKINQDLDPKMVQIHLFGLSYLPPLYLQFLDSLSKHLPIRFYQLSPCQKYWGDALTSKESHSIIKYWKKKNASISTQQSLENFLQDSNPILSNFGKLGREMATVMEEFAQNKIENYALPKTICHLPEYEELVTNELIQEETQNPPTLLDHIQADITLLRNPDASDPILFQFYDQSIQIHAAPKKYREVQVIYNAVLQILDRHSQSNEPIYPGDILVMAPNINDYLTIINSVFNNPESPLDIQLVEQRSPIEHEIVRGFLHLLKLAKGRWQASTLFQLLEYSSFRKKAMIDAEDLQTIHKWIQETKILWGTDATHRNDLLKREYPNQRMADASSKGTWEDGFGQLIDSLILKENANLDNPFNPSGNIEFSQSSLLNNLQSLINSLKTDCKPFTSLETLTLNEWSEYLLCILEAYFSPYDEIGSNDSYNLLSDCIEKLKTSFTKLKDTRFTFESIFPLIENLLHKESSTHKENNNNAIKFSSLLPMRTVPAKVVVLMGLSDGIFPRKCPPMSWNLLLNNPRTDYFPDTVDFDRYLFLETILSARRYLVLSYISQEAGNTKELEPSLIVKELLKYLDTGYRIGNETITKACVFKHPLDSFDAQYFSDNARLKNYSLHDYKAAMAHYLNNKKPPHSFIESYKLGTQIPKDNIHHINIKSLASFAKNPIKAFLNSQQIYIERDFAKNIQDDADLFLSELNSWILTRDAVTNDLDNVLSKAEKSGMLPQGSFKDVCKDKIIVAVNNLQNHLESLNLKNDEILPLIFNEKYLAFSRESDRWVSPPLSIHSETFGQITIVGSIDLVTPQGIMFLVKDELKRSIELWPTILVYACLIKEHHHHLEPKALFLKGSQCTIKTIDFNQPHDLLKRFVEYYLSFQQLPSPLSPEKVHQLLTKKMLEKQVSTASEDYQPWQKTEAHQRWIDLNSANTDISSSLEHWESTAKHLYASMPSDWHPKTMRKIDLGDDHEDV